MSHIFSWLATGIIFFSCGNKANNEQADKPFTNDPVYKKGVALIGKNKCLTCHAINETITGPPYSVIGKKYENAPDSTLSEVANHVIAGSTGIWGQAIMIPHPGVSKEEAEAMVRYIILIGKNTN